MIPVRFTSNHSDAELDAFGFIIFPDESDRGYSVDGIMYHQNDKADTVYVDGAWVDANYRTLRFEEEQPQRIPRYLYDWFVTNAMCK